MARKKKKLTLKERFLKYAKKQPVKAWSYLIIGGGAALVFTFLLLLVLSVRFGAFGKLPTQSELMAIKQDNATIIYGSDRQTLGKYFIINRTTVDFDDIALPVYDALVATEDSRFFEHRGIDLRAWARVLFKTIIMQDPSGGGGSTLSQQLAKNLFPRKNYWKLTIPVAKFKEMFIATRLERAYEKEELLNLYLNTVPFGANVYGVQAAARTFFNKDASDVNNQEAAMLVGMLKANTKYNPVRNPKSALSRRNIVLLQMAKYGYIRPSEADSLKAMPIELDYYRESDGEGLATYFREHLRQELKPILKNLKKDDGSNYNLYTDGLKIHTTINTRLQAYAEQAVAEHMKSLQNQFDKHWKGDKAYGSERNIQAAIKRTERYKSMKNRGASEEEIMTAFEKPSRMTVFSYGGDVIKEMTPLDSLKYYYTKLNAGFIATDPKTGDILAWVGGIDQQYYKYDHVKSKRQAGSVFKPIVYATAIENGIPPCSYIENQLVTYADYEDWQPHNADDQYGGVYSMEGAIRSSVNSVAVNLIMRTGVDSVRWMAESMGIKSKIPKAPSIALGTAEVSLYDMAQVYGTLANRGVHNELQFIKRIETKSGEVIYEAPEKESKRVISENSAAVMTHLLQAVVDSGTARRLRFKYQLAHDVAGKTGTTQSHADGWFMGYTPDIVGGAWVGGEYPTVRFRSLSLGQGANTALPIFGRFMKKVAAYKSSRKYVSSQFDPLTDEQFMAINCLPYLDEMPMMESELEQELDDWYDSLEDIFSRIGKNRNQKPKAKKAPQRPSQAEADKKRKSEQAKERERVRKKREKLKKKKERKKKLKKRLEEIFGNN